MRVNTAVKSTPIYTHEGAKAVRSPAKHELERAVASTMLFENTFYEKGSTLAARIEDLCTRVKLVEISNLALRARNDYKLRHVPLFLCLQLIKRTSGTAEAYLARDTIYSVVQRPDEMGELIAQYWKGGKRPLPASMKRGLALAFEKFTPYQFAKWNRDAQVKLRDVMFLVHPIPSGCSDRAELYTKIANNTLKPADTWEVALSVGADKRETFTRLLSEKKLGYMALLMNLRNMEQAQVDRSLVTKAIIDGAPNSKALPFRFVAAVKHAPSYAKALSTALESVASPVKLEGETAVLIDVSGSMNDKLSAKSETSRMEAAGALSILVGKACDDVRFFTFSNQFVEVPGYGGLAMIDGIINSQAHQGTALAKALAVLRQNCPNAKRVIVITDEQSQDGSMIAWAPHSYLLNVASYAPGLNLTRGWNRICGWSERSVEFMAIDEQWQKENS